MDVAQQKVLLSSKLLTEEQKSQCATMVALSSVNSKYTAEQLTRVTGVSAETLANWGLVDSTDSLTIAELAELAVSDKQAKNVLDKIIAQNAQAVANGEVTASNIALASSEGGATLATGAFTTAIKANISAMWTWMTTTPLGWLTLLAAGVFVAVKAYDALTISVEEQKEKMEESLSAYEDAKSELSGITTELENQEQAMNELLAKEKLTYAEKGQLEELQAITRELRIQKDLAEKEEDRTEKQLAKDATDLFDKQFGDYEISEQTINKYQSDADITGNNAILISDENDISAMIAGYKQFNELLDEAYGSGSQDDIDHFKSLTEDLEDSIFTTAQELQTQQDNISAYYESIKNTPYEDLTTEQKEIVDTYNAISNAIALIYQQLDPNTWNSMQVDNIFSTDGIEKTKDELVAMAQSGELTPETIKGYTNLNNALGETTLSAQDLCDELYAIADAQGEVQGSTSEKTDLFTNLTTSKDALEDFISAVESASDAYSTLMNPNVSTSDMLSSILSITEAVSEMGGKLNWEFIESSDNSLKLLGDTIDYVSEKYTKSALVDAGFGEEFAEVLANSIVESQKAARELENVNTQIDSLQAAYDDLTDIVSSYNKTGYITFDQLQTLLELEPQYLACLVDENGQLQLNQQAMAALANQRLNDAETQAVQQAIAELGVLSLQDEKTAVEENTQAFSDAVTDLSLYNTELANTIAETSVAATAIRDLNAAISGAESKGASDNQIDTVLNNLDTKLQLIADTRDGLANSFGKIVSSSTSSTPDYKSILDKEITAQEKAYEAGKTTFKEYLDNRKQLVEKYYHDKKITTAEYYEELEDLAQAEADFYDEVLAAVTRRIQREIDGIQDIIDGIQKQIDQLEKQKDTYDSVISAVTRRYDKEIESINDVIEALEKQNEELEEQKDTYDSVISAVTSRYDKEIDGIDDAIDALEKQNEKLEDQQSDYDGAIDAIVAFLGEQKDAIQDNIDSINDENDSIQDQIDKYDQLLNAVTLVFDEKRDALQAEQDAIQDRIDALQAENDEYEKAIELEKAKDALLKAQTQRNKYLYSGEGRGFIYQTDTDAIADAEQTLSELTFQSTVDALEKEKELLQDVIDKLDETEQAWQDIADAFDNQKAKSTAQELFGDDYESIILNGDPDMIASIMNQYTSAQQKLEDNDNTISSLEEQMAQFDEMIEKWESVASAKEEATNQENAALLLGEQWQELILANKESDFEDFKNKYLAIQNQILDNQAEINSLNEKKQIYQDLKDQWSSITEEYQKNLDAQNALLMLGATWEADILSGRIETYEGFRDNYLSIQAQIDDNQSLIDSYNEKIEYYENLKAEWEELSSLYQEMLEDKMAQDILGADWETQIQAGRLEAFDSFKNDYLSIQAQINDNQALIDSYNEKIEYYEDLKAQWEDISDIYQREVDDQLITQALGANGEADILAGRLETLNAFKEQYLAAQQALADAAWASANEQIKAAQEAEKGANGTTGDSPDITNETPATPQYLSPSKTNVERIAEDLAQFADDFESGSTKSGGGAPALDKRLRLQAYAKGGIINDENSSGALDWLAKLLGEDHTVVVGNGERVLSSKDNQAYEKLLDLSSRIQPNIPDVNVNPFDYTKIRSENREMNVTQNINITLPNVTNTSGYDKLVKELQGLQIMAYQNSFKK